MSHGGPNIELIIIIMSKIFFLFIDFFLIFFGGEGVKKIEFKIFVLIVPFLVRYFYYYKVTFLVFIEDLAKKS